MTLWRVRPGDEAAFLDTTRELAEVLLRLPGRPGELTLVQSTDDPTVFHSIGWFHSQDDLEAMRQNADARRLLDRLVTLSSECRPTAHRVTYTMAGPPTGAPG
ncbi:antibiotic biosynthesis monooxygenase family protein [Actinoplanes sp. ATCC 53533]|uniref:antibiotic biosynthesis monooxygenase family protein n=1 Tax=Actinoplanes sp. ATCC 53533 TaxID=1288362 RepID=UPI0013152CC5|nr:antibiotic biosynthesis monooxygenase family protein [Actinoplanes sp. ATCC 53533]